MIRFFFLALAIFFSFSVSFSFSASARQRHALVVGIDNYTGMTSLKKAAGDARAIHAAFSDPRAGVSSTLVIDPDHATMLQALGVFSSRLNPGDEAIFYFAGHGVEIGGINYLLPADLDYAELSNVALIRKRAFSTGYVMEVIASRQARVSLLILDACRNDPARPSLGRSARAGLGRETPPQGSFILFSAGLNQIALDRLSHDDPDPNSVFTRVLLPLLRTPGMSIQEIAVKTRGEVLRLAQGVSYEQFPAYYDQLLGAFHLIPATHAAPAPAPAPAPSAASPPIWNGGPDTNVATLRWNPPPSSAGPSSPATPQIAECRRWTVDRASFSELQRIDRGPAISACRGAVASRPEDAELMSNLGRLLHADGQLAEALRWNRAAAERGDAAAMTNMGFFLRNGLGGAPQDDAAAARWYRMAADRGSREGMFNLALAYQQGWGVPRRDAEEAMRWYRAAADRGHPHAMNTLGADHERRGQIDEALRWYQAAAAQGDADAANNLARLGSGAPLWR